ncbi:protein-methionine-sulfoxide reductase catalytic subunit MsrP [Endozoicomonas atrinae]|uniref:protein-methionine-sulfoxide reductase catalytic subunit MsrP n=1 Tax=Endozoicomonas atrinae TaxID=1333660 RepID=UPI0008253B49|nr:protein-methionine-sulfoxide reductase catalytic subunit MsrP [Endozoicomonas atrinae]
MLLKIKKRSDSCSSEITPESIYHGRRHFMQQSGRFALAGLGLMLAGCSQEGEAVSKKTRADAIPSQSGPEWLKKKVLEFNPSVYTTTEALTPHKDVTTYNNFYEFGTGKGDPIRNAHTLKTEPWSVVIEGEVAKPGRYHLEDILKPHAMEERIYRLRCVEAWSMVIPWIGIPLSSILKQFEPTSKARFVEFTTLHDPEQMPGQKASFGSLDWPYVEGLRIDEAMNPLTLMATGLYGDILPNQNGAPFRLVVPWKYGFKSIKSIVKIRLTEKQPKTTWETSAPEEYGFYANVNPAVDHPRWSQKHERRLPSTLLSPNRIKTRPFNGYGEEVADLYKGMDLTRFY